MKFLFIFALLWSSSICQMEKDLVTDLPGLNFKTNFKTYSGYLKANEKNTWRMHYMLTESKSNPETDPLLVWFNGGPGCSSYAGLFEELGPFYINRDGETIYENVYSWNAKANVLYLESPIGVGYSYDSTIDNFFQANDDQTAYQNYQALYDFFTNIQPKYANRTFYLSGESYAGIYIPTLTKLLVEGINNGSFPYKNFQGAAIGNGFMNVKVLLNSLVVWSAYHGRVSLQDWDKIKTDCNANNKTHIDDYDFTTYMESKNGIDYTGKDNTTCGQLLNPLITMPSNMVPYNYYQDCYEVPPLLKKTSRYVDTKSINSNTADLINRISTDNQWGFPCWNDNALATYSNDITVQDALHIPKEWRNQKNGKFQWTDCNDDMYNTYNITYDDTSDIFKYILNNVNIKDFRFLIYNGDVDTVCNYLGDAQHIRKVAEDAKLTSNNRIPWYFSRNKQTAGFYQRYSGKSGKNTSVTIDVLTVKGAGHMVPNDRPGPSVQMITNFMFPTKNGSVDYSVMNPDSTPEQSPLLGSIGHLSRSSILIALLVGIFTTVY